MAVTVADQEKEAIAVVEGLPLTETVAEPVRVVRAVFVGRADRLALFVPIAEKDGCEEGDPDSDTAAVSVAVTDGEPVLDAAGLRVPVRVAVPVRVTGGDRVICRVRVALALAPSGGGIEARADLDPLTEPDAVRLILGVMSAVLVTLGVSVVAGLTDWVVEGMDVTVPNGEALVEREGAGLTEAAFVVVAIGDGVVDAVTTGLCDDDGDCVGVCDPDSVACADTVPVVVTLADDVAEGLGVTVSVAAGEGDQGPPECVDIGV